MIKDRLDMQLANLKTRLESLSTRKMIWKNFQYHNLERQMLMDEKIEDTNRSILLLLLFTLTHIVVVGFLLLLSFKDNPSLLQGSTWDQTRPHVSIAFASSLPPNFKR